MEAFLAYISQHKGQYAAHVPARLRKPTSGQVDPSPRAVCNLLHVLCNIRGVKVISRFLNNEPRYLEQMLMTFVEWEAAPKTWEHHDDSSTSAASAVLDMDHVVHSMNWEERYIILLWISHLLLAPFPLATLSSEKLGLPMDNSTGLEILPTDLPSVARTILSICFKYICAPGKEKDAATVLLARLALRVDMQRLGLLESLHTWVFKLLDPLSEQNPRLHTCLGALSFISRLHATGQTEDLAPYILRTFTLILKLTEDSSDGVRWTVRSSATARKTIIKILRSITVRLLDLPGRLSESMPQFNEDTTSMVLENSIDYLLLSLGDTDNPVRFAASKALSLTTLNLEPEMASDVIEALLNSLNENILYERPDGALVTPAEAQLAGKHHFKRNVSAVDPLRWQGLILTLAHLLFRRAAPPFLMRQVVQCLIEGLDFEQRSSTGTSVGTGIRDAACFGLWSLPRKYTTQDLLSLDIRDLAVSAVTGHQEEPTDLNTLQVLAIHLVRAACLDPWGNIRRGASAALQEMIGRHPDTILEGIPLLQIVDYHAVARRERALTEVATGAASLQRVYWNPLLDGLMQWRGIRAADSSSRRHAARALGRFALLHSFEGVNVVCASLLGRLSSVSSTDVESRHGLHLSLAAVVDAFFECQNASAINNSDVATTEAAQVVSSLWEIFGSEKGPNHDSLTLSHLRPDLTAEASARLISSLSRLYYPDPKLPNSLIPSESGLEKTLQLLLLCVSRDNEIPLEASSEAASSIFPLLSSDQKSVVVRTWISQLQESRQLDTGRAIVSALCAVYKHLPPSSPCRKAAVDAIIQCTSVEEDISKRVTAVAGLTTGVMRFTDDIDMLTENVIAYLNDYTTDRRGDIGSLIRLQALKAVNSILQMKSQTRMHDLMMSVVRLSAEKMDKVRQQAWSCLEKFWLQATEQQDQGMFAPFPPLQIKFQYFSDVNRRGYFFKLLSLSNVAWLCRPLVKGFASSMSVGSEGVIRESRFALIEFLGDDVDNKARQQRRVTLLVASIEELESNMHDERFAVPLVEFMAFILDNCFEYESQDEQIE